MDPNVWILYARSHVHRFIVHHTYICKMRPIISSLCDKGKETHRAATARSACLLVIFEESWASRAAWEDSRRRADHSMPGTPCGGDAHTSLRSRRRFLSSGLRSSGTKRNAPADRTRIPSVTSRRRRLSLEPNDRKLAARQVPRGIQIETSLASWYRVSLLVLLVY